MTAVAHRAAAVSVVCVLRCFSDGADGAEQAEADGPGAGRRHALHHGHPARLAAVLQ